jgi:hypothetical protein
VEGARVDRKTKIMHWYVDQVLRLGTTDQWARRRFLEVQGMLREAPAILKPDMLFRVLVDLTQPQFLRRPVRESGIAHEPARAVAVDPCGADRSRSVRSASSDVFHPELLSDVFGCPPATDSATNIQTD